jgi:DNA-binding NarL/FixJ family response regulator
VTTGIPRQRINDELRARPGRQPAVTARQARRPLNPIYDALVGIITQAASANRIPITAGDVRVIASHVAPLLIKLPYEKRHTSRSDVPADRREITLTTRERQVIMGLARGLTARQIGYTLFLTEDTVKSHLSTAYRALGARNASHAVAIAITRGVLTADEIADI